MAMRCPLPVSRLLAKLLIALQHMMTTAEPLLVHGSIGRETFLVHTEIRRFVFQTSQFARKGVGHNY